MKVTRLKIISTVDKVFITGMLTLFFFVWVKYFMRNNLYSFLFSLGLSLFFVSIFTLIKKIKLQKSETKIATEKQINSFVYSFLLMTKKETLDLFYKKMKKKENVKISNEVIILNKTAIVPILDIEELSINEIAKTYQKMKSLKIDKLVILTITIKPQALQFSKSIKDIEIKILEKKETFYEYIQRYTIYPEILLAQKTDKKESFITLIKLSFNRSKIKSFVFSGSIMLVLSFFFRYSLYYVVMSSLLFLFAIISFFFKNNNTKNYS